MSRTDDQDPIPPVAACTGRERRLVGLPSSAGVAIGPVFRTVEQPAQVTRNKIHASDTQAEAARLDAAIIQSRKQLLK